MADQSDSDFRTGLLDLLRNECLIIVDDFNELLDSRTREVDPSFAELARQILQHYGSGRMLLISDQSPDFASWLQDIAVKTMAPPRAAEAETMLHNMLKSRGLVDEVPSDSTTRIVDWLGRNPRAMQAFVACLIEDPLDELLDLDVNAWEIKEETVSQGLVSRLEHQFLSKTINRLDPTTSLALEALAVFRKPFAIDALHAAMPPGVKSERVKDDLSARFLLSRDRRWYQLNPVARRISLSGLAHESRRRIAAHSRAGDHFLKRTGFDRPQQQIAAGANFIEARFHLLMSGRDSDYQTLAGQYRRIILQNYRNVSSIPADELARDHLLKTLASILDDDIRGYGRLRGLLAHLLTNRNHVGDQERALRQVTLATRESTDLSHWLLRADLTARFETGHALLALASQALGALPDHEAVRLTVRVVEHLSSTHQEDLALQAINAAMKKVSLGQLGPLYTSGGFLLQREGRTRDAVDYLEAGYRRLGSKTPGTHRLFEQALFLAFQIRDAGRINKIRQMVFGDPLHQNQVVLCDVALLQIAGEYGRAAELSLGHHKYFPVAAQAAFCWLVEGEVKRADDTLSTPRFNANSANVWLRGVIALCQGASDLYEECMRESSGGELHDLDFADRNVWLRLWDHAPSHLGIYPAFYFPCLPTALTGLDFDIIKRGRDSSGYTDADLARMHLPSTDEFGTDAAGVETPDQTGGDRLVINITNTGGTATMSDTYNVSGGQVGAVGRDATAGDAQFTQNVNHVYQLTPELLRDLRDLNTKVVQFDDASEHGSEIVELQKALESGEEGDETSMRGHLARAGKWVLEKAADLGMKFAYEAIKHELGM